MNYLWVFIGGGIGSLLRYCISNAAQKSALALPVATLISNVVSCFIFAGVLYYFKEKNLIPDIYKTFILVGICGGLSTFSTFSFETFELIKQGLITWAVANIVISCLLCTSLFFIFSK